MITKSHEMKVSSQLTPRDAMVSQGDVMIFRETYGGALQHPSTLADEIEKEMRSNADWLINPQYKNLIK